jgi:NADPH2:quinone reductase
LKLVQAEKIDAVDDYRLIDAPMPSIAADAVLIQVMVCGMGYVDALVALGGYQVKPPVPFTPGQEISGRVAAVGSAVSTLQVGDRVMANSFGGGLAEYVAVPQAMVTRIPDVMTFAQAAGFRVNYLTALHGLRDRAALQPGERLLVFGAAGGVGSAAVQVGKHLGAEVIAVASSDAKRAFARDLGADAVLDSDVEGWRDRLKALCGGKGPDVIFDPVAGPLFEAAFRSLNWGGRHLVVGFVGGPIPKLPINLSLMKGAALIGVDVRQFLLYEGAKAAGHLDMLLNWVAEGGFSPPVGRIFVLDDFADAMRFAMSGAGVAKSVIHVAEPVG